MVSGVDLGERGVAAGGSMVLGDCLVGRIEDGGLESEEKDLGRGGELEGDHWGDEEGSKN